MYHNVSVEFREEKLFSPHLLSAHKEEDSNLKPGKGAAPNNSHVNSES